MISVIGTGIACLCSMIVVKILASRYILMFFGEIHRDDPSVSGRARAPEAT